ncbi:family 10 glycosylhydrolase [Leptolyngbya sp. FACHB-321]|uniref:family 10 glycosylhydrolase n=1 Tax=Leptolyngbya sp. FACHB-321 TaxID=2692807 RepID=UPI001682F279|nr:family 10 glycosylhydrolase [Leptolyngbya sp. FACHB-321]MBD2037303.1 family 10 glycosylhydrolase [Leptolyngbya sp. FACHB-321]
MPSKKENSGCGCSSIPISFILVVLGIGYWGFTQIDRSKLNQFLTAAQEPATTTQPPIAPVFTPAPRQPVVVTNAPPSKISAVRLTKPQAAPVSSTLKKRPSPQALWEKKAIRGIYLSRYQATNNASEKMIRERVRYYRDQGINTIIHGVWGNGCTMYNSDVMQQILGYKSCPNQFQDQWLNWLIDEAHKQGMQVHAYFEKGIKIDKNSPIFDLAISKRWLVPGVDKTYAGIDHYVLDMEVPEVANFFRKIAVEFVQKYPTIDAVQWDDYLGYHAGLPGKVDRTDRLTKFVRQMRAEMKKANPSVSFDLCHHNPYWGKRYFAADWQNWNVDRVFIQTYNDANFNQELDYAKKYAGVAISDQQLYRLKELVNNTKIKSVLLFPSSGKPEETAALVKKFTPISN